MELELDVLLAFSLPFVKQERDGKIETSEKEKAKADQIQFYRAGGSINLPLQAFKITKYKSSRRRRVPRRIQHPHEDAVSEKEEVPGLIDHRSSSTTGFVGETQFSSGLKSDYNFEDFKVIGEPTLFNSRIWTEYSKLLAIQDSDSFCEGSRDAVFPDTYSTSLYYRCQNGRKELYQCIEGFEFDPDRLRCTAQNTSKNKTSNLNCYHQMDGFYPNYSSNCEDYFKCKNGFEAETATCPPDQAFSFHLQSCQLKKLVTCVKLNCHTENDGFYLYPGSKCQAYYYCRKGVRSDFLCPKGSIFNKQSKSCVESGICYEPVCAGRIDGSYADTTQDCTRSFECKGGVLEAVSSCPPGQTYNGSSCTIYQFGNCEKPEKTAAVFYFRANDECKALHDGSHTVPGTDCRNVRICSRGKTTAAFECPRDQRYNGQQCLPKEVVPCDDVCSMKPDGYYADEFTDCQGYYLCLNGKVVRRKQCPHNNAFNGYMCVPDNFVSCPKKSRSPMGRCLGLKDGFHPDYLNGCRNYFYCYNHEMVLTGSCSQGMTWEERQCVESKNLICDGPKELDECAGLSPGLYQNKSSGCTKYFYCNSGSGTILSCPPGHLFNGDKCVSADEYTCLSSSDCINQPDGYRQDKNTGCRSYYYCSNGNKITYVCPDSFIFNGSHCVSSELYKCPFTPSTDCIGKSNGYHPDIFSDCKKYYYCHRGEKLNTLTCGGKKVFDGQGCVLVDAPKSFCLRNEKECAEKQDGIYMDPESNCRRYFSCKNKIVDGESWCPEGHGFDGSACVKNFSCSSKNKGPVCYGNHLQFFQDLQSECKNYYVCIGRIKTIASCPRGTIFNGHLCIDSNYYKCPSEKS